MMAATCRLAMVCSSRFCEAPSVERALDTSVAACDALYQEILVYRDNLSAREQKDLHEVDFYSLIPPETTIQ